jgi:hypothetical protein
MSVSQAVKQIYDADSTGPILAEVYVLLEELLLQQPFLSDVRRLTARQPFLSLINEATWVPVDRTVLLFKVLIGSMRVPDEWYAKSLWLTLKQVSPDHDKMLEMMVV